MRRVGGDDGELRFYDNQEWIQYRCQRTHQRCVNENGRDSVTGAMSFFCLDDEERRRILIKLTKGQDSSVSSCRYGVGCFRTSWMSDSIWGKVKWDEKSLLLEPRSFTEGRWSPGIVYG